MFFKYDEERSMMKKFDKFISSYQESKRQSKDRKKIMDEFAFGKNNYSEFVNTMFLKICYCSSYERRNIFFDKKNIEILNSIIPKKRSKKNMKLIFNFLANITLVNEEKAKIQTTKMNRLSKGQRVIKRRIKDISKHNSKDRIYEKEIVGFLNKMFIFCEPVQYFLELLSEIKNNEKVLPLLFSKAHGGTKKIKIKYKHNKYNLRVVFFPFAFMSVFSNIKTMLEYHQHKIAKSVFSGDSPGLFDDQNKETIDNIEKSMYFIAEKHSYLLTKMFGPSHNLKMTIYILPLNDDNLDVLNQINGAVLSHHMGIVRNPKIMLSTNLNCETTHGYAHTFLHELVHWADHTQILNEIDKSKFDEKQLKYLEHSKTLRLEGLATSSEVFNGRVRFRNLRDGIKEINENFKVCKAHWKKNPEKITESLFDFLIDNKYGISQIMTLVIMLVNIGIENVEKIKTDELLNLFKERKKDLINIFGHIKYMDSITFLITYQKCCSKNKITELEETSKKTKKMNDS